MLEVLVKFDEPIRTESGETYFAQAVGKEVGGGMWEGWLEFLPRDEGPETMETGRETTQPNRTNLEYWAQGLTKVYLEGALARAVSLAAEPSDARAEVDDGDLPTLAARRGPPNPRTRR